MKNTVRLLAFILVFGLLFFISACEDTEPTPEPTPTPTPEITEYNVLGNWVDGGDGVYTLTTNTASELSFTYAKATYTYGYMSSRTITDDLSIFKKLVVTVEGSGTMLLKLETSDGTPAKEIGINVTGIQGTYQWNLNAASAFLAKVNKVVIIAAPGKTESIGSIKITSLKFDVAVADGFIVNDGFNNIPTNVNEYNGTDVEFSFNSKWESNDAGIYEITYDGTEAVVDYDKGSGLEWAFMRSRVQGTFTDFNYAVFIVQGTAGHKLLIKPNEYNSIESFIILNGSQQELVIDLTSLTTEQKNAIVDFKVFIAAGLAPAAGQLTIIEAFMIDDYDYVVPVFEVNEYNGTDPSFSLQNWYDNGDLVYDIVKVGTDYEVDYVKLTTNLHYAFMFANLDGDFSKFAKLEFEMTGQNGKTILLKVESPAGNKEVQFTFDGTKQTFVINLLTMTTAQLTALNKVVMFAAPGGVGSGEFIIHGVTFKTSDVSVKEGWTGNDAGVYTFTYGTTTVVNYTKIAGQEYSAAILNFDLTQVAGLNTITIIVKGTAGKSVILKPNDATALEKTVTFADGNPVTNTFTAESFTKLVIMAEPNVAPVTGSFEIVSIVLSYVKPVVEFDPTTLLNVNSNWAPLDVGTYTFTTETDGSVSVNFAHDAWKFFRQNFNAEDAAGLNTMTFLLSGTAGTKILIKPNDSNALEQWITLGTEPSLFVSYNAAGFTNVIIAANPEAASTGVFTIESAVLSYSYDFNDGYSPLDTGTYTFVKETNGSVTVDYAHDAWKFFRKNFDAEMATGLNTMVIKLSGTAGTKILIKPNDSNALEQWITLGTEPSIFVSFNPAGFTNVIMAANPEAASTGEFVIHYARLSYVAPEVEFNPLMVLDLTKGWIQNDPSTYTAVEGETTVINYTKAAGQEWVFVKNPFDAEDTLGMNTFTIVLKGTATKQVMVKVNNSIERTVTFVDANPITVKIHASDISQVIIFAEPNVAPATGSFEIVHAMASYEVNLNSTWIQNDPSTYAVSGTNTITVDYTKAAGQEWVFLKNTIAVDEFEGMNTITLVLQGTLGKQVMVKVNNSIEQTVTFVADPVTVTITAPEITGVILFAEPNVAPVTGTFQIISAYVSFVPEEFNPLMVLDLTKGWIQNDPSTYTAVEGETTVINYTKAAGQEWVFVKNPFDAEDTLGMNTFTIVLKGTATKQVMVKVNNSIERTVTFVDANPITVKIHASDISQVIIFAEPNVAPATGSFEIVHAMASYEVNLNSTWIQNDPSTYAVSGTNTITVDYTKAAGQEWVFLKNTISTSKFEGMNTITLVLQGTLGKQVMVKVNNSIEQTVTFVADPVTVTITAPEITGVILFAEPNVAPVTGTFQIISAYVSFVPEEFDPQSSLDLFNGWIQNDPSTYATVVGETVVVNYTKAAGQEWVFIKNPFDVEDALGYNTFTIVLKGTATKQVMVKVNNSIERTVTFVDANPVTVVVRASEINQVILFAEPNVAPVTGTFEIVDAHLSYSLELMSGWVENDLGTYTVSGTGPITVNYTKGVDQAWVFLKNPFDVADALGMNTVTIVLQGTLGKQVMVKVNNSIEQTVTFTAEPTTVTVSASSITGLIIFAEGGTASVSGSFQIISAVLTYVPQP